MAAGRKVCNRRFAQRKILQGAQAVFKAGQYAVKMKCYHTLKVIIRWVKWNSASRSSWMKTSDFPGRDGERVFYSCKTVSIIQTLLALYFHPSSIITDGQQNNGCNKWSSNRVCWLEEWHRKWKGLQLWQEKFRGDVGKAHTLPELWSSKCCEGPLHSSLVFLIMQRGLSPSCTLIIKSQTHQFDSVASKLVMLQTNHSRPLHTYATWKVEKREDFFWCLQTHTCLHTSTNPGNYPLNSPKKAGVPLWVARSIFLR